MTDYWFAPLTPLDPRVTQDDYLRALFTLRRPPASTAVHNPNVFNTVQDLIAQISPVPADLGNVLLGSHATLEGQIHLPMFANQGRFTDYEILIDSLASAAKSVAFPAFGTPSGLIHFRGCNVGKFRPLMLKLKQAFGNQHDVTAPKHFHVITLIANEALTAGVGVFEHMSYAFRVSRSTPFTTVQELINALVPKGYTLVDGTPVTLAMYQTFTRGMHGAGLQEVAGTYQLGENLAQNTSTLTIPTVLHVETNGIDHDATFEPGAFPSPGNEEAAFRTSVLAADYLQPGYLGPENVGSPSDPLAFPFYKRLDVANAQAFYDVHTWVRTSDPAHNVIHGVGTRYDYELRVPVVNTDTNLLVYNFFPLFGSTDPAITYLQEGDSFYFGNTSLPV